MNYPLEAKDSYALLLLGKWQWVTFGSDTIKSWDKEKNKLNTENNFYQQLWQQDQRSRRNHLGPHWQNASIWNLDVSQWEKKLLCLMNVGGSKQKYLIYSSNTYGIFIFALLLFGKISRGECHFLRSWMPAQGYPYSLMCMNSLWLLWCQGSLWCQENQQDQDTLSHLSALLHQCLLSHQPRSWDAQGTLGFLSFQEGLAFPCYLQAGKKKIKLSEDWHAGLCIRRFPSTSFPTIFFSKHGTTMCCTRQHTHIHPPTPASSLKAFLGGDSVKCIQEFSFCCQRPCWGGCSQVVQ